MWEKRLRINTILTMMGHIILVRVMLLLHVWVAVGTGFSVMSRRFQDANKPLWQPHEGLQTTGTEPHCRSKFLSKISMSSMARRWVSLWTSQSLSFSFSLQSPKSFVLWTSRSKLYFSSSQSNASSSQFSLKD